MTDQKTRELENKLREARELSEKSVLSVTEQRKLDTLIAQAKAIRETIAIDSQIDGFTRSLSGGVSPAGPRDEIVLGPAGNGVYAVAEKNAFQAATKSWQEGGKAQWGFDIRYKADVDLATAEVGSSATTGTPAGTQYGGAVAPFHYPGIIEPATRQPMIADLFAQGATDSNLVRLVKETFTSADADALGGFQAHGATVTAEGAPYGPVKLEVGAVDFPVRDITALLPVTEDILMDIPAMSAYLSSRVARFVQLAEESELVRGDGTGLHLQGLNTLSGVTTRAQGGDDLATAVMKLVADVHAASFMEPEWIAMNASTWAKYVTQREGTGATAGAFLAGPVSLAAVRQIWGIPITVSPVIPTGKVLVGNPAAGMIFRNGGLRVESSTGYGTSSDALPQAA
jgi:HK97 family phage major capsid protein